jgi:hypothetical protein
MIRNKNGTWIDSSVFREEGMNFTKYGKYIEDPYLSPTWFSYWKEQRDRCINGYEVDGCRVTGDHYFYLNFCPIMKVQSISGKKASKAVGFPDFWDGDYNYFWAREIARKGIIEALGLKEIEVKSERLKIESNFISKGLVKTEQEVEYTLLSSLFSRLHLDIKIEPQYLSGGFNLIVGKSRRKGYTLKAQAIAANNYLSRPKSYTAYGAYEKKFLYPKGIFSFTVDTINFVTEHTGWSMPSDVLNRADHIKASYIEYQNGIKVEKGFKSEVQALTFKDNADALRGKDAYDIFFEESGAFGTPGLLKASYKASEDCVMAGSLKTGMITVFGTSGDMESGTYDYADMFSKPKAYGFLPIQNTWDEGFDNTTCGFFHPICWNMEGYYDDNGNSDITKATEIEMGIREELLKNGASSVDINQRMQEKPLGPNEAFGSISVNTFPVVELKNQLRKVIANDLQSVKGTPVELTKSGNNVLAKPIMSGKANPITALHDIPVDKKGCVVIYEAPVYNAPKGLYKIGYDPVRQEEGTSLAAIIVYKGVHAGSAYHSTIVAEYVGRFPDPEDIDRVAENLAIYYNTQIMYENEVTGVKNYFRRIKRLDLLAHQPDKVISKNIKNSKVSRVYGCHMNVQLKDAAERYTKTWLLTTLDHDENDEPITVIDRIYSRRLLEELIEYYRKGNFDLISALFMCLFQQQEESLGLVHKSGKENHKVKDIMNLYNKMFNNE